MIQESSVKNVLIVTRDFPPFSPIIGWFIRIASLANYLASKNIDVHIICIERYKRYNIYKLDKRIHLHTIKSSLLKYDDPKKFEISNANLKTITIKIIKKALLKTNILKIDYEELILKKLYMQVQDLVNKYNIKNIIISSPPHSFQLLAKQLKREYGDSVTLISDFRDPWSQRPLYNKNNQSYKNNIKEQERRVFENVDMVTVVSHGMKDYYEQFGNNICVIQNGYDIVNDVSPLKAASEFVKKAIINHQVVIGYFGTGGIGTMEGSGKDIQFLFECIEGNDYLKNNIALLLQGDIRKAVKSHYKFNHLILPMKNNEQTRSNIRMIHIGIIVYTNVEDADAQMGAKIYDYISENKPIIAFVPGKAKSIAYLAKDIGGIIIIDPLNHKEMCKKLEKAIKEFTSATDINKLLPKKEKIAQYSRINQYKKFLDLLN
jgi:hypothetical protein